MPKNPAGVCRETGEGPGAKDLRFTGGASAGRQVGEGKFYGQATKGAWWMPWQKQAKKDVASCDKPRGAASRH